MVDELTKETFKLEILQNEYSKLLKEESEMLDRHILGLVPQYKQVEESRELRDKLFKIKKELDKQSVKVSELKGDVLTDKDIEDIWGDTSNNNLDSDEIIDTLSANWNL